MGGDAPADNIIATVVSTIGSLSLPLVLPATHRFGRRALKRGVIFMSVFTAVVMAVFAMKAPFDTMHQKRLFVLYTENVRTFCCSAHSRSTDGSFPQITSHEHHLHLAGGDGAPGLGLLVEDIAKEFGGAEYTSTNASASQLVEDGHNSAWDPLYPFSEVCGAITTSLV